MFRAPPFHTINIKDDQFILACPRGAFITEYVPSMFEQKQPGMFVLTIHKNQLADKKADLEEALNAISIRSYAEVKQALETFERGEEYRPRVY